VDAVRREVILLHQRRGLGDRLAVGIDELVGVEILVVETCAGDGIPLLRADVQLDDAVERDLAVRCVLILREVYIRRGWKELLADDHRVRGMVGRRALFLLDARRNGRRCCSTAVPGKGHQ
jgi:hypothetical protein